MRLVDNLRKAEKKGATAIRRGVERAREEWADVERRLRQQMRIYPQKSRAMAAAAPGSPERAGFARSGVAAPGSLERAGFARFGVGAPHAGTPAIDLNETAEQETNTAVEKPIISVHGHDVKY